MKQLKVTVEISDVRTYGVLDNVGRSILSLEYSSEEVLKDAVDVITLDALHMLINAAKDSHFEFIEKTKLGIPDPKDFPAPSK